MIVNVEDDTTSILAPHDMNDDERASEPPPPPPTMNNVPSSVSITGLTRVYEPIPSESFSGLGGKNLLQQIEAGSGPDDPAVEARKMGLTFYPFSSKRDWQLANYLTTSALSQSEIDAFLKLDRVSAFNICILSQ